MILYLDTSSLVKLYIEEIGSPEVREQIESADSVATSVVAFAEARSAFARLAREGLVDVDELAAMRDGFRRDWDSFLKVRVLKRIYERAAELAEEHALRGFDALHLASYLELVDRAGNEEEVRFSAFDGRLSAAAAEASGESEPHGSG